MPKRRSTAGEREENKRARGVNKERVHMKTTQRERERSRAIDDSMKISTIEQDRTFFLISCATKKNKKKHTMCDEKRKISALPKINCPQRAAKTKKKKDNKYDTKIDICIYK